MDISWAWLVIGVLLGTALGLMVMGALAERKVQEAQSRVDPVSYNRAYWEGHGDGLCQLEWERARWEEREQKWTAMVLELSAAVERFNPATFPPGCPACEVAVECNLAVAECGPALDTVDLGQKGA